MKKNTLNSYSQKTFEKLRPKQFQPEFENISIEHLVLKIFLNIQSMRITKEDPFILLTSINYFNMCLQVVKLDHYYFIPFLF